jgi:RNase P/RNase MRP subunit POP5
LNHHTSTLLPNDLYDELVKETQLMSKIIKTKNIISDKFWYYYITVEEDIKLEDLEAYLNKSLTDKYGIYTYAKSNNPKLDFKIDWSDFEKEIFTI